VIAASPSDVVIERKGRKERKARFVLRASRALRSRSTAAAARPSATSTSATSRHAPGADSHGITPKPPASEPTMAPAVFAA